MSQLLSSLHNDMFGIFTADNSSLFRVCVSSELFEGEEETLREPPSLEVVKCISLASLRSVPLEDIDGTSALEYAILSSADIKVVTFLMRLTQVQMSGKPSRSSFLLGIDVPKTNASRHVALASTLNGPPTEDIDEDLNKASMDTDFDTTNKIRDSLMLIVENVPVDFGLAQVAQDLV